VAIQQLASAFLQATFGYWADRSGAGRWMAWMGVLLSGWGAAALGLVPGFPGLCLAMLATGVGSAVFQSRRVTGLGSAQTRWSRRAHASVGE